MVKSIIVYLLALCFFSELVLASDATKFAKEQRLARFKENIVSIQAKLHRQAAVDPEGLAANTNAPIYLQLIEELEYAILEIAKEENQLDCYFYREHFNTEKLFNYCNCQACGFGKNYKERYAKKLKLAQDYYRYIDSKETARVPSKPKKEWLL